MREASNITTNDECLKRNPGYTGGYAHDDPNCPCGMYKPGKCKTGVVISLWTSDAIDAVFYYRTDPRFIPPNMVIFRTGNL